jgi:hypothetical protein
MVQLRRHLRRRRPPHEATATDDTVRVSDANVESCPRRGWAVLRPQDQRTLFPLLALATLCLVLLEGRSGRDEGRGDEAESSRSASSYVPRIAINACHWSELCLLPGVSTTLAQRIVADRLDRGPFADPADLRRVAGIGPGRQSQLAGWLDFSCTALPPAEGDTPSAHPIK